MPQTKLGAGIEIDAKDSASPILGRVSTAIGNLGSMMYGFGAMAGRLSPALAGATQGIGAMGSGAVGMLGSLGKAGPILGGVAAAAGVLVVGIGKLNEVAEKSTRIIMGSIDAYAQYERSLLEVQTVIRGTNEELRAVSDSALGMSVQFGTTAENQLKAFYETASAGFENVADSTEIMTTANKLAVGGVADVMGTVDLLTTVLNGYGISAQDSMDVSDALFTAVRLGKTNVRELASSFGTVVPSAVAAGASLEETAAAMAALTLAGQSTDMASTNIARAFDVLIKKPPSMIKAFKQFGLEEEALDIRGRGLLPVIQDIGKAFEGNEEALVDAVPEIRAFKAIMPLATTQAEAFAKAIDQMGSRMGATDEAVETMSRSIDFQRRRWTAFKESVFISLGETFAPLIGKALGVLEKFMDAMNALPRPVKSALLALAAVGLSLPMLGGKITGLIWGAVKLGAAFAVISAVCAVLGPMLIPIIVTVVGLAGAFAILAYTLVKKVLPGGEGLTAQLKKVGFALQAAYAFISKGELSGALAEEFLKMDEGTRQMSLKFVAAWDMVKTVFGAAKETIVAALDAMADQFGPGLNSVTDWIKGLLSGKTSAKEFAASIPIKDLKEFGKTVGEVVVGILQIGKAFYEIGVLAVKAFMFIKDNWDMLVAPLFGPLGWMYTGIRALGLAGHAMLPEGEGSGATGAAIAPMTIPSSTNQIVSSPPVTDRATQAGTTKVKASFNIKNQSVLQIDRKEITSIVKDTMEEISEDDLDGPLEMSLMTG